jgi:hypothetical protein
MIRMILNGLLTTDVSVAMVRRMPIYASRWWNGEMNKHLERVADGYLVGSAAQQTQRWVPALGVWAARSSSHARHPLERYRIAVALLASEVRKGRCRAGRIPLDLVEGRHLPSGGVPRRPLFTERTPIESR